MNILILGGTAEARALANQLLAQGHAVVTSLAGRTRSPRLPEGEVRVGGFGGASGLAAYLGAHAINYLVDATHPYAANISRNAVRAATETGTPLLRLMRPTWQPQPGQDWVDVPDAATAANRLPAGAMVLLTTGHADLDIYLVRTDCRFLVRTIEAPAFSLPGHAALLQDRPPYSVDHETQIMRAHGITHLVSKNSGGSQTAAKLQVAMALGIPVIMIARPFYDAAPEVASVAAAMEVLGE